MVGLGFPHFFPSTPERFHRLAALLMPALAMNVWLALLGAVFSGILTAHDRFDLARGVDLGVLAVRATGTVLVLNWGYGIAGLTIVTLICSAVALAANLALARRIYSKLRVWPLQLAKARVRELFGYGIWASLATNAYRIIGQTDLIVVGVLLGRVEGNDLLRRRHADLLLRHHPEQDLRDFLPAGPAGFGPG